MIDVINEIVAKRCHWKGMWGVTTGCMVWRTYCAIWLNLTRRVFRVLDQPSRYEDCPNRSGWIKALSSSLKHLCSGQRKVEWSFITFSQENRPKTPTSRGLTEPSGMKCWTLTCSKTSPRFVTMHGNGYPTTNQTWTGSSRKGKQQGVIPDSMTTAPLGN